MSPIAISIEGLAVGASPDRKLLKDISLEVHAGECCALIGPNGAGKSTLLATLSGRRQPWRGAIRMTTKTGERLADAAQRAAGIAVLAQDARVELRLRVAEYVGLGRLPHEGRATAAADRAAIESALGACDLRNLSGRTLGSLSGGERQRAHIARALAQQPGLLLLDEPTNHLDLRTRLEMLARVRALGITVVASLHDLSLVTSFADRVVVLAEGRVEANATPELALSPARVADVFGMALVRPVHPHDGRALWVFEKLAA